MGPGIHVDPTRTRDIAEDLAQDALVAALEQWPKSGIPDNSGAWLMSAAKHRAIDVFRRNMIEAGTLRQAQETDKQQAELEKKALQRQMADRFEADVKSVLAKLVSPRRYVDPDFLHAFGGEIYGGAFRSDPDLLRRHAQALWAPSNRGYLYQLIAAAGWTSLPWLPLLTQPTLVMHGSDDPIVPLINARILSALIRRAELHVVDDGHMFLAMEYVPGHTLRDVIRKEAPMAAARAVVAEHPALTAVTREGDVVAAESE